MDLVDELIRPRFTSPRVHACMSTRRGGVSPAPYDSFNLRPDIGDDAAAVAVNRARWTHALGVLPVRVDQVHGCAVACIDALSAAQPLVSADASYTRVPGLACEIQVADCLPVIFADRLGRGVAAAHAGWRGLAGGVLEATVDALTTACQVDAGEIEAWLGPCIGPSAFEVGAEVHGAFTQAGRPAAARAASRFVPGRTAGKWWADLAGLARDRLARRGVAGISGNDGSAEWCTFSNPSRFFSYRRECVTGRMAAAVWLSDLN